jgi:hypothetical protein
LRDNILSKDASEYRYGKVLSTLDDIANLAVVAKQAVESGNYAMARIYLRIVADECHWVCGETKVIEERGVGY